MGEKLSGRGSIVKSSGTCGEAEYEISNSSKDERWQFEVISGLLSRVFFRYTNVKRAGMSYRSAMTDNPRATEKNVNALQYFPLFNFLLHGNSSR